jgi:hypothetical protein
LNWISFFSVYHIITPLVFSIDQERSMRSLLAVIKYKWTQEYLKLPGQLPTWMRVEQSRSKRLRKPKIASLFHE